MGISIQGNLATVGAFTLEQYMLSFMLIILSLILMILVFSISMLRFRRKEKKLLEELEQGQEMR